jgi:hypothetical protein
MRNGKRDTQKTGVDGQGRIWYVNLFFFSFLCSLRCLLYIHVCPWAGRADNQKQEKRSKARNHLDPSHPFAQLPPKALLFDYQSSEHSSSGSDSSDSDDDYHKEKVGRRKELWGNMRNADAGPSGEGKEGKEYGWGLGLGMKILEVRTPSWRSQQVSSWIAPSFV